MPPSELADEEFRTILFDRMDGKKCPFTDEELYNETSRRADLGNSRMKFLLGSLIYHGIGTEKDADAADDAWIASYDDRVEGLQTVAFSHYAGSLGLDLRRAGDLFCRAADGGGDDYLLLRAADCYLAEYMETGDNSMGVLAFECYRNVYPDYIDSARGLAICFMYGIGTEVSYDNAAEVLYEAEVGSGRDVTDLKLLLREVKNRGFFFK